MNQQETREQCEDSWFVFSKNKISFPCIDILFLFLCHWIAALERKLVIVMQITISSLSLSLYSKANLTSMNRSFDRSNKFELTVLAISLHLLSIIIIIRTFLLLLMTFLNKWEVYLRDIHLPFRCHWPRLFFFFLIKDRCLKTYFLRVSVCNDSRTSKDILSNHVLRRTNSCYYGLSLFFFV